MATVTVTGRQLEVLRHSLGLDDHGRGKSYRNHYVAGGKNVAVCRSCVEVGWMVENKSSDMTGGDPWFSVTDEGQKLASSDLRVPGDCLIQFGKRAPLS